MGKLGRFACIFTPMALSIASLICLLVVFLGGLNKNDPNLRSLYYAKADMSQFRANVSADANINNISAFLDKLGIKGSADTELAKALLASATGKKLDDYYYIYLWNYCSGSKGANNGTETITYCSPRKASFYFNPIEVWGLNNTLAQNFVPKGIDGALNAYKKGAQWMFIAYCVAFWTTVATIVVGLFAVCSRIGSCVTSFVASAATLFTFLSALTSTILFSTLTGALNTTLKPYKVHASTGSKMFALDWIAVAFSIGASLFWTISICCCSGRSPPKDRAAKKGSQFSNVAPFGSRGYQPLGENHGHAGGQHTQRGSGVEMQDFGHASAGPYKGRETAYEPYRQV